ncbi:nuclear cap-binding protein subunit 3 [Skeletonema marinoi]|uniref:Nuclear cap-binding protein subunit 3 n=1 Tax=Skeletonema marinoi TaxID=267567 RepID=A0AAD9D695_9STRA|nr:nuclear cap-binding protein subunit 3 [Skeletonema marinoi]
MASVREVEHRSASACSYESSTIAITDNAWTINSDTDQQLTDDADNNNEHEQPVKCTLLSPGASIRVAPMERATSGWSTEHFHQNLKLPEGSNAGRGIIVQFEAMARECIAIALSPYHQYELGKTYVVHFGANGNLQTVIRRHVNYNEAVDLTFPSRVCSENHWIPYWICLQNGTLSAGVGKCVGKNVIGSLDDSMYNMLRSGVDAVRYVGVGNSALNRNARDLRVRNVAVMSIPGRFGLEGVPMEAQSAFVNILDMEYVTNNNGSGGGGGGGSVATEAELLAEYEKERAKAKARAAKFGIEYKEPAPDAFLKWSEARRLRANPERGFITGIDTFSAAEKAKADARKERFAKDERKRKGLDDDNTDNNNNEGSDNEGGEGAMEDEEGVDDVAEWEKTKKDPLPIEQAWENWKVVSKFRADPPGNLLSNGNTSGEIVLSLGSDSATSGMDTAEFIPKKIVVVPSKIHIFSIDWAPFKQIRTDDLLSFFRDYGPSYVEWLGELSCNVLFEDKHSAARALHALSQELLSPPPAAVDMTKRWEPPSAPKNDEDMNDENANGETNQLDDDSVRDFPLDAPPQPADGGAIEPEEDEQEPLPDFGDMGWRFCKWTVRKVSNDRYGRRGTRARVLMRLATSLDVLDDRPTEWPKPPPGFTTKRVLMPWHDFSGKRRRDGKRDTKRRRRSDGGKRRRGNDNNNRERDLDSRMGEGLSSGRAGFSVEEIEAERNAKNAEILDIST